MSADDEEQGEESPLVDFVTKKGTLEIVCSIGDSGASPTEIIEQVNISHDTVTNRLSDGERLYNVWYSELAPPDSEYRKVFKLDMRGLYIREKIDEVGMLETFHQILPYRRELREAEQEVKEWVVENESELESKYTIGGVSKSQGDESDQSVDPDLNDDPSDIPLDDLPDDPE